MSGRGWSICRRAFTASSAAFFVVLFTQPYLSAQDDQDAAQTPGVRLMQVRPEDKSARYDKSSYRIRILGLNTPKANRHSLTAVRLSPVRRKCCLPFRPSALKCKVWTPRFG